MENEINLIEDYSKTDLNYIFQLEHQNQKLMVMQIFKNGNNLFKKIVEKIQDYFNIKEIRYFFI